MSIRNEEAIHIMSLVCKQLTIDRQKISDNLIKMINKVILMDVTGADTNVLAEKMEAAKKKRTGLIDLYTSGDIDRDEFSALRVKYDAEIDSLKSMMESIEKQQIVKRKQQELMEDIKKAIGELISGIEYEDEFYTQLLDKMVVNDRENIDVYLNLLPLKWSYTVAKASKKAVAPEVETPPPVGQGQVGRRNENRQCRLAAPWNISGASLPISVSNPATSR